MSKELRDAIKRIGSKGSMKIETATVTNIDEKNHTIDARIFDTEIEIFNIRITATISENTQTFLAQYPKVGSEILIANLNEESYACLMVSEIEKVILKGENYEIIAANGKVEINAEKVQFNGGENHGMVKALELEKYLTRVHNWITSMDNIFRTIQVVTTIPGSPDALHLALKLATSQYIIPPIPNLQNDKITH
jgi:hypothetical protein